MNYVFLMMVVIMVTSTITVGDNTNNELDEEWDKIVRNVEGIEGFDENINNAINFVTEGPNQGKTTETAKKKQDEHDYYEDDYESDEVDKNVTVGNVTKKVPATNVSTTNAPVVEDEDEYYDDSYYDDSDEDEFIPPDQKHTPDCEIPAVVPVKPVRMSTVGCEHIKCRSICARKKKMELFPHATDCAKFCQCSHGKAYAKPCPKDLHYNDNYKICDFKWRAQCKLLTPPKNHTKKN